MDEDLEDIVECINNIAERASAAGYIDVSEQLYAITDQYEDENAEG